MATQWQDFEAVGRKCEPYVRQGATKDVNKEKALAEGIFAAWLLAAKC